MSSRILMLVCMLFAAAIGNPASAQQAPAAAPSKLPADPWPRDVSVPNAAVLVYQPQVNSWVGNQIDLRAALAIKPTGAQSETFGVVFATARTQVDKVSRMVVFQNLQVTKTRRRSSYRSTARRCGGRCQLTVASSVSSTPAR